MSQIMIAFTGASAIWITQQKRDNIKKYACLFGIAGQPFWFYSSFHAEQWGIFALCFFYSYAWLIGVKNHWL